MTGPTDSAKHAMYPSTNASSQPSVRWKHAARPIAVRHTPMPSEPTIISGFRPSLSTVQIASTVNSRLTAPTTIVWSSATSVFAPVPIFLKISGA